ncbi:MAG: YebC/PmpR family DNA-binding transcriptional regulator [Tindallia sp. MSAO_Bac2]|nr:MAG: YebC/PmpR family DNA-binding transcriptional regulator [Tindallia sp. MSAO_Bac2]
MGRIGNIKDRKNKQDSKKASIYTKIARSITVAAKEGGSDPEYNAALKTAMEKARSSNMPKDNIDRAIKKASGEGNEQVYERITYEGYGPSGVAIILEVLTDNRNRTVGEIRHIFDKYGGNLGTSGCVAYLFERVGQILIEKKDYPDEDLTMMDALESGANDIELDDEVYEITVDPMNFFQLKEQLAEKNYVLLETDIIHKPGNVVELTEEDAIKMEKLIDMLEDNDDVQEVSHNWKQ